LWEAKGAAAAGRNAELVPKLKLCPIWLPAVCTLPEEDGWFASNRARFQQARRHCMGVAELSYVLLQYAHLILGEGFWRLPLRTHAGILSLAWKMHTVHIMNNAQAFSFVAAAVASLPALFSWLFSGGLVVLTRGILTHGPAFFSGGESFGMIKWALIGIFGPAPPIGLIVSYATYTVINDLLDGRYASSTSAEDGYKVASKTCQATCAEKSSRGWLQRMWLGFNIQNDYFGLAEVTIVCHGLIPATMACWSLMRRGQSFEYIVAAKPTAKIA